MVCEPGLTPCARPLVLPLKRAWFAQKGNVDVLDTARLTPDETGAAVRDWVARQRAKAE